MFLEICQVPESSRFCVSCVLRCMRCVVAYRALPRRHTCDICISRDAMPGHRMRSLALRAFALYAIFANSVEFSNYRRFWNFRFRLALISIKPDRNPKRKLFENLTFDLQKLWDFRSFYARSILHALLHVGMYARNWTRMRKSRVRLYCAARVILRAWNRAMRAILPRADPTRRALIH